MRDVLIYLAIGFAVGVPCGIAIGYIFGLLDEGGARGEQTTLDEPEPRKPRWARTLADDEAVVAAAIAALPEATDR